MSFEESESTPWLQSHHDVEQEEKQNRSSPSSSSTALYKKVFITKISLLILIFLAGTICGGALFILMNIALLKGDSNSHRYATGEGLTTAKTYQTLHTETEYSSPDQVISDSAWDKYTINGFVSLPNSWAIDRGWPVGRVMPGDEEKGIYVVDGFHQLHCLMSIRTMVTSIIDGEPIENVTHTRRHLNHCYDALRQSIICRADPTPLYVPKDTFFAGDGQQRECKSWTELQDWVMEHSVCYNGVTC